MTDIPTLIAHIVGGMPTLDVAYQNEDGDWITTFGHQVWPYWTMQLDGAIPQPPEDWMEHLEAEAAKWAAQQSKGLASLLSLLPSPPPSQPMKRRF